MTNSRAHTREIPSIIGRAMAQWPKCTIQPCFERYAFYHVDYVRMRAVPY